MRKTLNAIFVHSSSELLPIEQDIFQRFTNSIKTNNVKFVIALFKTNMHLMIILKERVTRNYNQIKKIINNINLKNVKLIKIYQRQILIL